MRQLSAELGENPDAPEVLDAAEREAKRKRVREDGFRKVCADRRCTPRQLAAMPIGDVMGHLRRVVGEREFKDADPQVIRRYLVAFVES